jgi:hypothetical protein
MGHTGLDLLTLSFSHFDPLSGPKDEVHSFDHLVRADQQRGWHLDA